jgi:hypothetical protein
MLVASTEPRAGPGVVQQVGRAAGDDANHAHHEDPDEQLHLHGRVDDGHEDERDERHAGDAVGLEAVGARPDRIARVVARAVGDDPGVARVVLLDVEDDLHQIGTDIGDFREDAARDPERRRTERLADREADEAGAGVVAGNEEQNAQHDQQLDADEEHADAHARAQRYRVDRKGPPFEPGKRRARVREGVHADAEPRHPVAAGDADEAEEQDHRHLERWEPMDHFVSYRIDGRRQPAEVDRGDDADEDPENEDELALRDEVGLAGLVDELGDLVHRPVHGQVLQLDVDHHAEDEPEHTHAQPHHQQRAPVDASELDLAEVREDQVRLAAGMRRRCLLGYISRWLRGNRCVARPGRQHDGHRHRGHPPLTLAERVQHVSPR